jgi:hypothetical protein
MVRRGQNRKNTLGIYLLFLFDIEQSQTNTRLASSSTSSNPNLSIISKKEVSNLNDIVGVDGLGNTNINIRRKLCCRISILFFSYRLATVCLATVSNLLLELS